MLYKFKLFNILLDNIYNILKYLFIVSECCHNVKSIDLN